MHLRYIVLLCILFWFFFFNDTATTEIYTLSLHDALPIFEEARARLAARGIAAAAIDALLAIAAYQRAGGPTALVSPSVERLLGRRPRTIRDFARDYASQFV